MVSCSTVTAMIAAPVFQHLMPYYTWRDIMLLKGGIVLNGLPFGWLVAKEHNLLLNCSIKTFSIAAESKKEKHKTNEINSLQNTRVKKLSKLQNICTTIENTFETSLLKDFWFILFCFASIGLRGWRHLQTQYFVRYAEDIGTNNQSAATLLTVKLAMALIMCILVGIITSGADKRIW